LIIIKIFKDNNNVIDFSVVMSSVSGVIIGKSPLMKNNVQFASDFALARQTI